MTGLDFIQYSVSSGVHHHADSLVLDTARAIPATVRQAAEIGGGIPVHVGPVTMGPRSDIVPAHIPPDPLAPAPAVDERVRQAFGAVWAMAIVAGLRSAESATVLSTSGPSGVIGDGGTHPAGTVLAELAALAGRPLLSVQNSRPDCLVAIAVATGDDRHALFVSNRTDSTVRVAGARPIELPPYGWTRIDERRAGVSVESQDRPRRPRPIENG